MDSLSPLVVHFAINDTMKIVTIVLLTAAPYVAVLTLVVAAVNKSGAVGTAFTGGLNKLGGMVNNASAKYRSNARKEGIQNFKTGNGVGRFRQMSAVRNAGRRVGVGWQKGRFGFGEQGRQAMTLASAANVDDTLKSNEYLRALANNDPANAVLAFSGGTEAGLQEAARDLFTDSKTGKYDKTSADQAMAAARAAGLTRANATAALQTVAQNKSRAVGVGRSDIVQAGINRLTTSASERQSLAYNYQYQSRSSGGRADLGGDWTGDKTLAAADASAAAIAAAGGSVQAQMAARQQTIADLTMMDGVGRTEVHSLVRGHTNQVKMLAGEGSEGGVLDRMMASDNDDQRYEAALRALELQKNLPMANGDSQKLINKFFERNGFDMSGTADSLEAQLAARAMYKGPAPIGVANPAAIQALAGQLNSQARVYDQQPQQARGNTP